MFPFVNTLGAILAPVYGIMIVDYYIIKKQKIKESDLFSSSPRGAYYYNDGWNQKAFVAWAIAGVFSVLTVWHPALSGLGAPYWDPFAQGAVFGLNRGTEKGHIARAALESIALRTRDIIIEMQKDAEIEFKNLKVDGGASNNDLLMQIQSNLLGNKVVRPKTTETTALGAAYLAGLAVNLWEDQSDISKHWKSEKQFNCKISENKIKILYQDWLKAVEKSNR